MSQSKQRALKQCQGLGFSPSDILIQPNLESAYMAAELGQGKVKRIGIPDCFGESAPYQRLLAKNGITVEAIVDTCKAML